MLDSGAGDRLVRQQIERTATAGTGHIAQLLVFDHFNRAAAMGAMDVHETGSLDADLCLAASVPHEPLSRMLLLVSREGPPTTASSLHPSAVDKRRQCDCGFARFTVIDPMYVVTYAIPMGDPAGRAAALESGRPSYARATRVHGNPNLATSDIAVPRE